LGKDWRQPTRNELNRRYAPLLSHRTIEQPKLLHRYLARKYTEVSKRTSRYIWIKFRQGRASIFIPFPLWSTMLLLTGAKSNHSAVITGGMIRSIISSGSNSCPVGIVPHFSGALQTNHT
jgi:hypothetical protein